MSFVVLVIVMILVLVVFLGILFVCVVLFFFVNRWLLLGVNVKLNVRGVMVGCWDNFV